MNRRRRPLVAAAVVACAVVAVIFVLHLDDREPAVEAVAAQPREREPLREPVVPPPREPPLTRELVPALEPTAAPLGETPVTQKAVTSWAPEVVVRVLHDGAPRAGTAVELQQGGTAVTDAEGQVSFPPGLGDTLSIVDVDDVVFHAKIADLPRAVENGRTVITVNLTGGTAEILVVTPEGEPVRDYFVYLFFVPEDPAAKEGVITRRVVLTDRTGVARVEHMIPGPWETGTFDYRSRRPTELHRIEVRPGAVAVERIVVEREPFHGRTEFQVALPADARRDPTGRCTNYGVEFVTDPARPAKGGSLYLGDPGDLAAAYMKTRDARFVRMRILTLADDPEPLTEWVKVPTEQDLGLVQFNWL